MRHARLRPGPIALTIVFALGCTGSSSGGGTAPAADGGKNNGQGQSQEDGGEPADGGSSGGSGGGLDAYWKQASSELTVIDSASAAGFKTTTVTIPALLRDGVNDVDIDAYQQIKNGELVTYAFRSGDTVYYRTTQALQTSDATSYVLVDDRGNSHYYTLEDGVLTDNSTDIFDETFVTSATKFKKHAGAFPPAGWPSKMVEVAP